MVQDRRKLLKYLKRDSLERYNILIEQLGIRECRCNNSFFVYGTFDSHERLDAFYRLQCIAVSNEPMQRIQASLLKAKRTPSPKQVTLST